MFSLMTYMWLHFKFHIGFAGLKVYSFYKLHVVPQGYSLLYLLELKKQMFLLHYFCVT